MINRAEQEWPEGVAHIAQRDFRAEWFAAICNTLKGWNPKSVKLTVEGHTFRCVPSVDGRVILYKDGGRNQYHVLSVDEWVNWATESAS